MSRALTERWGATFVTGAGAWHSRRDLGLLPAGKPDMGSPAPNVNRLQVPGANGRLDLSTALTGYVTYDDRHGTLPYSIRGTERERHTVMSRLRTLLHGQMARVYLDEDPSGYYEGRVYVEEPSESGIFWRVDITGDFDPYKYDITATNEDWLWDPFSFEAGVIRDYGNISVSTTKTVTVVSSPIGGCPVFTFIGHGVDDAGAGTMTMTYEGETYNLALGENVFPEIELPHEQTEVTFTFTFSMVSGGGRFGTVSIAFQGGML